MKPCASPLALLLIFALVMPALPARAAEACKESRALDSILASTIGQRAYLKACQKAVRDMSDAALKAQAAANPQSSARAAEAELAGQKDAAQSIADRAKAGMLSQQERVEITNGAVFNYRTAASDLRKVFDQFAKKDAPLIDRLPAGSKGRVTAQADKALNQELRSLYETSLEQAGALQQKANQLSASAAQLSQMQAQNQQLANQLGGGQNTNGGSGVSSGTWVALGGAALIAAGTVGGIAYFGNKGLDKMDKIADQKIDKFEDTAKDIIKDAEDSAKRIIEFASDKASKVLADAEKTVTNIMDQAKKDGDALIDKLGTEIQEQFENLSDVGIEKLRNEMGSVFDEAIAKAKNSGDSALEETLTKAREKTMAKIQKEIDRRTAGLPKSTVPNTNTATSTDTGTDSASSTSTATSTSSNSVTTTGSSTSTDLRE